MSTLESLLRRERAIAAGAVVVLSALAWVYVWRGAGMGRSALDMTAVTLFPHLQRDAMSGMSMGAPLMQAAPPGGWIVVVLMWWTMMIAMMTPSAAPLVLLYGGVLRRKIPEPRPQYAAPIVLVGGYLGAWLAFSIVASSIQFALQRAGVVSSTMLRSQSAALSAAVLLAAGLYQLTPLKRACLKRCRAPVEFLVHHWRPGWSGALRMGIQHGAWCIGCCWMLMALLFVGGVMNLAWVALLALLVLVEKIAPAGMLASRAAGLALIGWGAATVWV